jgi:hypothetical protein
MPKRKRLRRPCTFASALALVFAGAASLNLRPVASSPARAALAAAQDAGRVDIRLRSLTTRGEGKLTIEAGEGGVVARVTALDLPDPQTVAAGATTYVVWAVSGGRIVRLGELRRDARGNGGLTFKSPEGFERYGVVVTAEATPAASHPGDPVLSSRAGEVVALYPPERVKGADASAVDEIFRQEQLAVENLKRYAYKRRLVFQTDRGERYERVSELIYLDSGRNYERSVLLQKSSLGRVKLANLDFDGAEVILRPRYRSAYAITYRGRESGLLAFEVKTRQVEGAMLFQGTIWTDDEYRIVAASGEVVPEFLPGGVKTFKFTARRKDGLPLSLEVEDTMGGRRVYQSVSYYDFKPLRSDVKVIEEGEPGEAP